MLTVVGARDEHDLKDAFSSTHNKVTRLSHCPTTIEHTLVDSEQRGKKKGNAPSHNRVGSVIGTPAAKTTTTTEACAACWIAVPRKVIKTHAMLLSTQDPPRETVDKQVLATVADTVDLRCGFVVNRVECEATGADTASRTQTSIQHNEVC